MTEDMAEEQQPGPIARTEAPNLGGRESRTHQEHKAAKTKKPAREGESITVKPLSRDERKH